MKGYWWQNDCHSERSEESHGLHGILRPSTSLRAQDDNQDIIMDKFLIRGRHRLKGEVTISGAKNAALPLMTATLLAPGTHILSNIPSLRDVHTMRRLLEHLGAKCDFIPLTKGRELSNSLQISTDFIRGDDAPYEVVKTMRASVLVMGPLVGRLHHAKVSLPGGCAIGARPIDLHLKALAAMGADIKINDGFVEVKANKLRGARIPFDKVTVTGTENIMMAATLAEGTTILENAAREPEVADLANYLIAMGAKIDGAGTDRITIEGVKTLKPASHDIISDRIEAATFMIASALTRGDVTLLHAPKEYLETFMVRLSETGVRFEENGGRVRVIGPERPISVDITTAPHPGFATDLQAQFMALMTVAEGTSVITETIFENRFMHVPELNRLGASITVEGPTAVIKGKQGLLGAPVQATDLRASASLVLAGLAAEGETEINRIYHLDRGYEKIEEKLCNLGAEIERIPE